MHWDGGLHRRHLHRPRHTFCAHLGDGWRAAEADPDLAGHSDYKTTERYAHLAPDGDDGAVAKVSL